MELRDPEDEVLLRNTRQSPCTNCGGRHEFYSIQCLPATFPAEAARVMRGEIVRVPTDKQGSYRQAQFRRPALR